MINAQLSQPVPPQTAIDAVAEAKMTVAEIIIWNLWLVLQARVQNTRVKFPSANAAQLGLPAPAATLVSTAGIPKVTNGYPLQSIELVDPRAKFLNFALRQALRRLIQQLNLGI